MLQEATPVSHSSGSPAFEHELLELLHEMTAAQDELLGLLTRKREVMAAGKIDEMQASEPVEEQLRERLVNCHTRRGELLRAAADAGKPSDSLQSLAQSLSPEKQPKLREKVQETKQRIRLLQHESLANWVVAQRAVLHVAQILEILATGGKPKPTYERGETAAMRGNLINEEA